MQSTSLFLHWFPAVVSWTQRWHHDEATEELLRHRPDLTQEWDHATFAQLVLYPLVPYLLWAIAYYAKASACPPRPNKARMPNTCKQRQGVQVFVISSKKIQRRGYETLYSYMTRKPTAAVARFVGMAPPRWQVGPPACKPIGHCKSRGLSLAVRLQPVAYMGLHVALTTATFALTKLWWESYAAHTVFLAVIFCWAVWNGEALRHRLGGFACVLEVHIKGGL